MLGLGIVLVSRRGGGYTESERKMWYVLCVLMVLLYDMYI